jgi:hypothetical protein
MTDNNPAAEGETAVVESTDVKLDNPTVEAANSETTDDQVDKPENGDDADKRQALSEEAKKIHAYEKRIARQTARAKETERLLKEAQDRLLGYETKKQSDGEPKQEDFETAEEYLIAKGKYEANKEIAEKQAKADAEKKAIEYQKTLYEKQKAFEAKEAEFRKEHADYDAVVNGLNEFIADLTPQQQNSLEMQVFRDVMFDSENMAALSYELAKDPELMESLLGMHPLQIAKTLWKLENKIASAPKKTVTAPNQPPSALTGKAKANTSLHEKSPDELMKWLNSK